ncbi:phage tail protein [Liquorilactobacillus nagelii]|uniref:phage tail protein n=1 Tax=Liquorilactobacillus nagelii TaxID=82688 RepID=UPI0039E9AEA3
MTVLDDLTINKYTYVGLNTVTNSTVLATSNDAINFVEKETIASLSSLRDISIINIQDTYYISGTLGIYKTTDFINFTSLDVSSFDNSAKSLQIFQDVNLDYHVIYSLNSSIYVADFDSQSDTISNLGQSVNINNETDLNPAIYYFNDKYFIFLDSSRIFVSDNYLGAYTEVATNIVNSSARTSPKLAIAGDYLYLYQLNNTTMTYRVAKKTNPIIWSNEGTVSADSTISSGCFIYNANSYVNYPDYSNTIEDTFDPVVIVKALHVDQKAILSCLLWDTFQVQWSQNSAYQIQFTAYDDKSVSYALLQSETSIFFNDQEYIIKTCEPDFNAGVNTKQITATHVYNEIQYVRQYSTKTGTLTYSVADVLAFYLDNNPNNIGFTYRVFGEFTKQQITDLGNNSGKDMLSQILSTWTNAIIFPDNRQINVYTPDAFSKNFGRRIDYLNNTQEVKMTMDSTSITNKVYCIGKTKENSTDNATTEYYFQPFFVSDQSSISSWGLHPADDINDERFTDASSMKTYAQGQLKTEPALSVEVTYKTNEVPLAGETRHIKVNDDYETDVTVIGFTWYPFSGANQTVLEFDNLPASILNTQALINNRIRDVELIAQKALNQATTATVNYISDTDPNSNNTVRVGDLWTRKLEGGDT